MAKCSDYDPVFNAVESAVNTYGIEKQLTVFYGEIGELMTAVADCRRRRDNSDHVAEEMADVLICCKEIMYALGVTRKDVLRWEDVKLRRLAQNLAQEPEKVPPADASLLDECPRIVGELKMCASSTCDGSCHYYGKDCCCDGLMKDAAYLLESFGAALAGKEPDT